MKNLRIVLIALALVATCINVLHAASKSSDETLFEEIKAYADSLQDALEIRNYKLAKDNLDLLYPLLKKEMKLAKKEVKELEKSGSDELASDLSDALKRKSEIHDRLHALTDVSTAGLRVKANDVKLLVDEYVELLELNKKLLSSN